MFSPIDVKVCGNGRPYAYPHPCRVSVPFAKGVVGSQDPICIDQDGVLTVCQTRTLKYWPDGSIKWCCLDWISPAQATPPSTVRVIAGAGSESRESPRQSLSLKPQDQGWVLDSLASAVRASVAIHFTDVNGVRFDAQPTAYSELFSGPISRRVQYDLKFVSQTTKVSSLVGRLQLDVYHSQPIAVCRLMLRNPTPAKHPNGNWDLGNEGSVFLNDFSIEFGFNEKISEIRTQAEPDRSVVTSQNAVSLFQASSGGENWNSSNHLDKDRRIPMAFRGYQIHCNGQTSDGLRSTPQVSVSIGDTSFTIAMRRFWENFPKSLTVSNNTVRLGLLPKESKYAHELQGGEQKTHEFAIQFGNVAKEMSLDWYLHPSNLALTPQYYASTQSFRYLTPRDEAPNTDHQRLVDCAIEGNDTFLSKREKIDEYGWRHYGDIYGDHEAVYRTGTAPLISHYNNQYDCTGGFAAQYMRTGDVRWFDQMIEMADHAWDIDTYHTTGDKNLYNGGLFWHTYHYADADTGTHRSYPRSLTQTKVLEGGKDLGDLGETGKVMAKNYGLGGGPSGSQNYPTGWMWAYYLTGQDDFREAAINAADYVMRIEDGRKTIFRWLCTSDTGFALESSAGYYGPGRASANSLHALMTGFELTDDRKYLNMAERLIRRVAHPDDDIETLDLGNAELRWFYTMHFQALSRYIDLKTELGEDDLLYGLAISTYNHYADWMVKNERPTLDQADRLQYPTETWVAQDMRKWHVLQYAAWMNQNDSRRREAFQQKADYFFEYVCKTLAAMPTHSLCRPVVLMMHYGWQRHWFLSQARNREFVSPKFRGPFESKPPFRSQRSIAIKRAKALLLTAALFSFVACVVGMAFAISLLLSANSSPPG